MMTTEGNRHPFDFPVPFGEWDADGNKIMAKPLHAVRANPSGYRPKPWEPS
jgi:hypothetical protein